MASTPASSALAAKLVLFFGRLAMTVYSFDAGMRSSERRSCAAVSILRFSCPDAA
ncbi:MAG: hypothetical protein JRM80_05415 [Nitrososphaerota archaeon]|nr:hypothetical protein [Nitrososphaerota archaeon]